VEVVATGLGITSTEGYVPGQTTPGVRMTTFSVPAGVRMVSAMCRVVTDTTITSHVFDLGYNDGSYPGGGASGPSGVSFANKWQPIVAGFREGTGANIPLSLAYATSAVYIEGVFFTPQKEQCVQVNSLVAAITNHLRLVL